MSVLRTHLEGARGCPVCGRENCRRGGGVSPLRESAPLLISNADAVEATPARTLKPVVPKVCSRGHEYQPVDKRNHRGCPKCADARRARYEVRAQRRGDTVPGPRQAVRQALRRIALAVRDSK